MKNVARKLIGVILCMVLVISMLSGCGTSSEKDTQADNIKNDSAKANPVTINMVYVSWGEVPPDLQEVENTFNEKIAIPKINVKVHLVPINGGSWNDQTNLLLQSGEGIDLMMMFGNDLTNMVNSGQIMPMTQYLDEYGKDIKKKVEADLWPGCSVNNEIYCVPEISRTYGCDLALICRQDLCDKYGITASHLDTLEDIENVLKTIHENEPDLTPLINGANNTLVFNLPTDPGDRVFSNLGFYTAGAIAEDSGTTKVENYYESPEYRKKVETVRKWYQAGYLAPNNAVSTAEDNNALWDQGKVFAKLDISSPGYNPGANTKIPTKTITLGAQGEPRTGTGEISIFGWMLTSRSKYPEQAMQLLNLIYSDEDATNLLAWGIEGKHYVKTGTDDREIDYPEGITTQTVGYTNSMNAAFGDFYHGYYFKGSDPNIASVSEDYNKNKQKSKFLGFTLDQSNVKSQMAVLDSVVSEYAKPLEMGAVNPDEMLPKFLNALDNAGIKDTIAEFQKQIDEWSMNQNKQ